MAVNEVKETKEEKDFSRFLGWLELNLRAARAPGSPWWRWWRRVRWCVIWSSVAYGILLVIGLTAMSWIGERNWIFSLLLFLPPTVWLLPFLVLLPLGLIFCQKICLVHLAAAFFVVTMFTPLYWSLPDAAEGATFTVLSNNIGERRTRTLFPLIEEVQPDLIALQDSSRSQALALMLGQELHLAEHGRLILVSRFPILASGIVDQLSYRGDAVAMWAEIEVEGRKVFVYNVHLPTPRHDFNRLRGRGFLAELPRRGGIYSSTVREAYRESLRNRIRLAEETAALLGSDERLSLVVGDLNAPSQGYVRRLFHGRGKDAFAEAGRGYGLTLPGVTRNPISLFGPWLRIDYIFTDKGFRVLDCWVEGRQRAQHLAVVARLELPPP